MAIGPDNALIVQSDCSILLDVHAPRAAEEEFAHHRKLFLTEQGYSYQVVVAGEK